MQQEKLVILIQPEHVKPGIEKYEGKVEQHLFQLLSSADLKATPYLFNDGRILLDYEDKNFAFLYKDKSTLLSLLAL